MKPELRQLLIDELRERASRMTKMIDYRGRIPDFPEALLEAEARRMFDVLLALFGTDLFHWAPMESYIASRRSALVSALADKFLQDGEDEADDEPPSNSKESSADGKK